MPMPLVLDLERALSVLGNDSDAHQLARYMSLNGTSLSADIDVDEHQKQPTPVPVASVPRAQLRRPAMVTAERELSCLLCARPAVTGQRQCQTCGGCLVVVTVA